MRRNILLLHNAALGDFVLTWPLAMALGRMAAQSRVFYVTSAAKGELAQRAIGVESADIETGWHHLHGDASKLPAAAKRLMSDALMIFAFAQQHDHAFEAALAGASDGARVISIVPNPPPGMHVWDHQVQQLDKVPPLGQFVRQMHDIIRQRGLTSKSPKSPHQIIIHPGSGSAAKNWPLQRFLDVAAQLQQKGRDVSFVIGEVEQEQFSAADINRLSAVGVVQTPASPSDLFEILQNAGGYIGNDSGPTHLAAMIGRPTVALFGPASDASRWAPQGPEVTVLPFETPPPQIVESFIG